MRTASAGRGLVEAWEGSDPKARRVTAQATFTLQSSLTMVTRTSWFQASRFSVQGSINTNEPAVTPILAFEGSHQPSEVKHSLV